MQRDINTGYHKDTSECKRYFTDGYFHHSDEVACEIKEAGFTFEELIAVTSFGNAIPNIAEKMEDEKFCRNLLDTIRLVEKKPTLMGISSHYIGIGRKE